MKKNAFTLVELMVSVGIFIILIAVFSGFFSSAIQAQRKVLASQEIVDNISYTLEYMSRAIRMAKKDMEGECLTTAGAKHNYETNNDNNKDRVRFLNYQEKCQEFFLADGRLYERKSTDKRAANFGASLPLTPAKFQVSNLTFNGSETWGQDNFQPKVILFLEIEELKIRTSISQRDLNVEY